MGVNWIVVMVTTKKSYCVHRICEKFHWMGNFCSFESLERNKQFAMPYTCKECGGPVPLKATIYPCDDVKCIDCLKVQKRLTRCSRDPTHVISDIEIMWRYAAGFASCACIQCDPYNNYLCFAYACTEELPAT